MPSVDKEFHLWQWLELLHIFVYGGKIQDDDYIFPCVTTRSLIQPGAPISHDTIQSGLMSSLKMQESNLVMDGSQHTASDVVVHNIGSCMHLLGSNGAWQPFDSREDGLRVNMYALVCLYHHCTD